MGLASDSQPTCMKMGASQGRETQASITMERKASHLLPFRFGVEMPGEERVSGPENFWLIFEEPMPASAESRQL
jgi:hypothetical protein